MGTIVIDKQAINPPVLLSPLAGITDLPFRNLVLKFGAGLVVSEMIASQEIVQAKPDARAKGELGLGSDKTSVQLAARDPYWGAEAAKYCAEQGAKIIDINMGCPAKKVTSGLSGSALMRTPDVAHDIIKAIVGAVDVPVTLKMRLGWDEHSLNAVDIAKTAQDLGVKMIVIHGRTRCQFYKGQADWAAIRPVVDAVDIPVIANGDIWDVNSAREAMERSGAAGVMIGRAARGRPWLLAQVASSIFGISKVTIPTGEALMSMIIAHYREMLAFYGEILGVRAARKHLGWYMDMMHEDGLCDVSKSMRHSILTEGDPSKVIGLLEQFIHRQEVAA